MAQDSMNKSDLVEDVADALPWIGATGAKAAVEAVFELISQSLDNNVPVRIVGFGTFEPRVTSPRKGRNPQTGAVLDIPAKRTVHFKPATALKSNA